MNGYSKMESGWDAYITQAQTYTQPRTLFLRDTILPQSGSEVDDFLSLGLALQGFLEGSSHHVGAQVGVFQIGHSSDPPVCLCESVCVWYVYVRQKDKGKLVVCGETSKKGGERVWSG